MKNVLLSKILVNTKKILKSDHIYHIATANRMIFNVQLRFYKQARTDSCEFAIIIRCKTWSRPSIKHL